MVRFKSVVTITLSAMLAFAGFPVGARAEEAAVPSEQESTQGQTTLAETPASDAPTSNEDLVVENDATLSTQDEIVDVVESDPTASNEEVVVEDESGSTKVQDDATITTQSEGDALQTQAAGSVRYRTHVQRIGWQGWRNNGATSGTSGMSRRLEGIKIAIGGVSGGIEYRTHVQKQGWQGWRRNGAMSGTSNKSLRLEAIQIRLTGAAAKSYNVYYRVHAQKFGWMGWACNGGSAGTAGYSYRLEAIQIRLVPKGQRAPGSTANAFRKVVKSISGRRWKITMPSSWGGSAGFTLSRNQSYGPYFSKLWRAGNRGSVWYMFPEYAVADPTGMTVRLKSGQTVKVFTGGGFGDSYVIPIHNINSSGENLYVVAYTFNALRQLAACTSINASFSNP